MSKKVLKKVQKVFKDAVIDAYSHRGDETLVIKNEKLVAVAEFLRDDPETYFDMPIDATGVDYVDLHDDYRFEVVYHLYSVGHKHRIRLKARCSEENPSVPSLTGVWKGMNWMEREVFDMFGITFVGHPDLRRLLLYPEFEGHPLRKDYDFKEIQPLVPFLEVDVPMSLGTPFHGTNRDRGVQPGEGTSAAGKPLMEQRAEFEPDVDYVK